MGFDPVRRLRDAALVASGAAAALALANDLQATAALALVMAVAIVFARRRSDPPVAAAMAPPPAGAAERWRLQTYLDLSPAPLLALRPNGRLHALNRVARRLLGNDGEVDPPSGLIEAMAMAKARQPGTVRFDIGGHRHAFALVTADIHAGEETERVAALIDIDAGIKAAEASALRQLVQVLGHELANSLTPITSMSRSVAEMLADPESPRAELLDAVETISRRSAALLDFAEAYRSLTRLPQPSPSRIRVATVLEDAARMFAAQWPGKALRANHRDIEALTISVDREQLVLALAAILQNAAEAGNAIILEGYLAMHGLTIAVQDDGRGIDEAVVDRLFEPFFTTKVGGSGIGLALARQIVEAHNGRVTAENHSGGGARVALWLPV